MEFQQKQYAEDFWMPELWRTNNSLNQMITKQAIMATAKLHDTRDTAKRFYRDEYPTKIEPYKEIVKKVMDDNKFEPIFALLKISQMEVYKENGFRQMMFIAATVELIEQDKQNWYEHTWIKTH